MIDRQACEDVEKIRLEAIHLSSITKRHLEIANEIKVILMVFLGINVALILFILLDVIFHMK
jgi:hypothetical protein